MQQVHVTIFFHREFTTAFKEENTFHDFKLKLLNILQLSNMVNLVWSHKPLGMD